VGNGVGLKKRQILPLRKGLRSLGKGNTDKDRRQVGVDDRGVLEKGVRGLKTQISIFVERRGEARSKGERGDRACLPRHLLHI